MLAHLAACEGIGCFLRLAWVESKPSFGFDGTWCDFQACQAYIKRAAAESTCVYCPTTIENTIMQGSPACLSNLKISPTMRHGRPVTRPFSGKLVVRASFNFADSERIKRTWMGRTEVKKHGEFPAAATDDCTT